MRGKRRWLEWGKDMAIVLLSLSAIYLLTMTPLVQDSGLLSGEDALPEGGGERDGDADGGGLSLPHRRQYPKWPLRGTV